jgi:hypothetical protein
MLTRAVWLSLGLFGSVAASAALWAGGETPAPHVLNDHTFEKWRAFIHPSAAELASDRIDWNITLWGGLTRAQEQGKPLMIWIMNGHPTGCT